MLDEFPPLCRISFVVQPETDIEQHGGGGQRRHAFGHLTAGAADFHQRHRRPPGQKTRTQRTDPAIVQVTHTVAVFGLDQECCQCGNHQQGFQAFAHQDKEGTGEGRRPGQAAPAQALVGQFQLALDIDHRHFQLIGRYSLAYLVTKVCHGLFNIQPQFAVYCIEPLFHQFETFQVGFHRGAVRLVVVTGLVGGYHVIQPVQ